MKCASCNLEVEFKITGLPKGWVRRTVADFACVLLRLAGCNVELCVETGKCEGGNVE